MKRPELLLSLTCLGASLAMTASARAAEAPDFKEVFDLLRGNVVGLTETQLNRAAVDGLLARVSGQAWIVDPSKVSAPDTNTAPVSSIAIFDDHYGYIRIARLSPRLPEQFVSALANLSATNKLKGLVIDLRYAVGADYAAAVKVADRFLGSEQPMLDWGQGEARSTDKTNAFRQPVAILVNQFTSGAAEALAALFRQKDIGLLIGTNTAGQASVTRDFKLKSGDTLRIATGQVKGADGQLIQQLAPDIRVDVSPEDERAYFVDAYKSLPPAGVSAGPVASLTITNKPRRRINEAELVRMLRDGENPEEDTAKARPAEPARPVITDPALARAIDLLKALAVVRQTRA